MTQVEIPLTEGDNYLAFPATSTLYRNFRELFIDSGMINNVDTLYKYEPMRGENIPVDIDANYIEEGRGYILRIFSSTTPIPSIKYEGIEYTIPMTFDLLRSMLLRGLNLVGIGSTTITLTNWCRAIDGKTWSPVTQLEPKKAYWIYYDECIQPRYGIESAITVIGAIGTVLFTYWLLREFKIVGK